MTWNRGPQVLDVDCLRSGYTGVRELSVGLEKSHQQREKGREDRARVFREGKGCMAGVQGGSSAGKEFGNMSILLLQGPGFRGQGEVQYFTQKFDLDVNSIDSIVPITKPLVKT